MYRNLHLDLGIKKLLPDWKALLNSRYFFDDLIAGITVAFVAIPLSLAIALASGVSPGVGLITAIVAGIVCALFGGSNLTVSGPAAAMSILLADIVEKFGLSSLVFICLIAGMLQVLTGVLGLGRYSRYVPLPVIAGFTAGIGVIILIGQLPRAFGLAPPDESHIFSVFNHITTYFHEINGTTLFLVVTTIVIIRTLPKVLPRVAPILPAVATVSAIVYFFNLDVELIGQIPNSLPQPSIPSLPTMSLNEFIFSCFTVYVLASLETLLSASAIDKIAQSKKHNADQELIGQGLGNIAVSFFGGIPVTGVIARSATNVRAGAKTRRASIIHSFLILLSVYAFSRIISQIPIAALAGVLFSVAAGMINYKEFRDLWVTARGESIIYAVTFFTIIFVDLIGGVQAGVAAAAIIILFKAAKTHLIFSADSTNVMRLSLAGNLTFLSMGKIANLYDSLGEKRPKTVVLDVSAITHIDSTAASAIVDIYQRCKELQSNFFIKGLSKKFEPIFRMCGGDELIDHCYLVTEQELRDKTMVSSSSRGRLVHGVKRFYMNKLHNDKRLFDYISQRQDPHTLFITCSDSRLVPSMITCTDPGELFIIRNVGNFIPPYNPKSNYSEIAALEFALSNLNISDIVVCGHANCGAMKACSSPNLDLPEKLGHWIGLIKDELKLKENMSVDDVAQQNVLNQIRNLQSYPIIQQKLKESQIHLHAWFLNLDQHVVYEWDKSGEDFKSIVGELLPA